MSTIGFYIGIGALVLIILVKIPVIGMMIRPMLEAPWKMLVGALSHSSAWLVWFVKELWNDHATLLHHLLHKKEDIDVAYRVQKRNQGE